jgi:hypothetical protein
MLDKAGVGVQVSSQLINSLLFADDITLIANSEQELNTLLDIHIRLFRGYSYHLISILFLCQSVCRLPLP